MKKTLVRCLFMGIVAPVIIVGGLLFGVDYMAKTYIPKVVNEVETLNKLFDTEISEMNIKSEAVPLTGFYGVNFGDSKEDLLKRGLITKIEHDTYTEHVIDFSGKKDSKPILGDDEISVYFYNDIVSGFALSDDNQWNYSLAKNVLTEKYGTPHSWVNAPTSLVDIIEPSFDPNTGFGKTQIAIINEWEFPDHNVKIQLTWIPDFDEYNFKMMLHGYGHSGRVGLIYTSITAKNQRQQYRIDNFTF